ncbi:MAG: PP2C family protein-serine/threonine phosphatase, partial [Ilumatobacteraceae bacterium]
MVLVVSLLGVVAAVFAAWRSHTETEQSLLDQHTDEAGAVLTAAIAGLQSPLASGAELLEATDGNAAVFSAAMARFVGEGRSFSSVAAFEVGSGSTDALAVVGEQPVLTAAGPERVRAMIDQTMATDELSIIDILDQPARRLGYGFTSVLAGPRFVVYAESPLPADPTTAERSTGAFSQLDYALYLGAGEQRENLLYANVADLPITGRRAAATIDFGDTQIVIATQAGGDLGGTLSRVLPWLVAGIGLALAVGASMMTEWLLRRRETAERLTADVVRLYDEQRRLAETLQRSLLPSQLQAPSGMAVAGRYWPADSESEVGGDFYDLFPLDDGRWAIVIGDVCGKGVDAAALTGLTRHTVRAAARHVLSPAEALTWTHEAIDSYSGETYCTVCVGFLARDPSGQVELTLALGGHPGPLLCRADGTVEEIGLPGTVL